MRISRWKDKLTRLGALDGADRRLLLRAAFWLGIARIRLASTPFQRLVGEPVGEPGGVEPDVDVLQRVGYAVRAAAANVPWRSDCFPQTIAARTLLKRLGFSSTIHLGVERTSKDNIAGHAWLTCGETVVVGGQDLNRYTELL